MQDARAKKAFVGRLLVGVIVILALAVAFIAFVSRSILTQALCSVEIVVRVVTILHANVPSFCGGQ